MTDPKAPLPGDPGLSAALDRLAAQVRHPALTLYSFLTGPVEVDETIQEPDEADLLSAGVTPQELQQARLRRAAVLYTANLVIARCLDDLTLQRWDPDTDLPITGPNLENDDAVGLEESFVWGFFPPRFRHTYTREFHTKVLVTATKVAYDLARPDADPAACLAEELILNAICQLVDMPWDLAGLGRAWLDPSENLLEDTDFEYLFQDDMDGIESDPAAQADQRMWIPGPTDWFTPFNDERVVHPYCQTERSTPEANDLQLLLDGDSYDQIHDPTVIDDPRPITGLTPISDAVATARAAHVRDSGDMWVPDHANPENSLSAGITLVGDAVSGWLTWQPNRGSDHIRTDPVIQFSPHRHFPVGRDQPWAAVAITASVLCVPLSAVVAFRPDRSIREDWHRQWSNPILG